MWWKYRFKLCSTVDICNVGDLEGTVAVASLLIASMIGKEVNPKENAELYFQLAITATFFAGVFQAALGLLRSAIQFFQQYGLACYLKIKFLVINTKREVRCMWIINEE